MRFVYVRVCFKNGVRFGCLEVCMVGKGFEVFFCWSREFESFMIEIGVVVKG